MTLRVTVLTVGSRGDVQPYAVLARDLKDAGHRVTLATHRCLAWLAEADSRLTRMEGTPLPAPGR